MSKPLSPSQKDSVGLRFYTKNDAINYARYLADRGHELFSSKTLGIVECYIRQRCDLYVRGRILSEPEDFAFCLSLIPHRLESNELGIDKSFPAQTYATDINVDGQDALVFGWVRESAERPQQVIPSPEWSQRFQEILKFFGDSPPRPSLRSQLPVKLTLGIPEREVRMSEIGRAEKLCGGMDAFVESAPQLVYESHCVAFQNVRDFAVYSDLADYLIGLTIIVGEGFYYAFLDEGVASRLEIIEISTRECDE